MRRYRANRNRLIAAIAGYLATLSAFAAAPLVDATIDPAQITVGESARLTLSTVGADIQSFTLPVVPGLEFRVVERLEGVRDVHGASIPTRTTVVSVTARAAGTFIIPGITPRSQPLVLRVSPTGDTLDSKAQALPGKGAIGSTGSAVGGIRLTEDGSAYMRLTGLKQQVYVGESVPIVIELGIRAGFVKSVNGLPTLTGSDFTFNNLSRQPERVEKIIEGKPFILFTWRSVLAAIKPGKFSFSVNTPLTIKVSTRSPQEARFEDQLGDPFLQRIYGATVPKDIVVASPNYELDVLALPVEGRPSDFSGAVGTFNIASDLSPAAAAAGDPLTLRMRVKGSGNFDRVDSPMLGPVDRWKTYPPKSSFNPADSIGYKGEKTFEQPVIASQPGTQVLPGPAFSYFDPTTRRYETARSPPLSVTISPPLADSSATAPISAGGAATYADPAQSGLRPDHFATGPRENTLVPLYLEPRFLAIPSFLGLGFAAGWLVLRRGGSNANDRARARRRRLSKAAKSALDQMQAAALRGDTARFLNLARSALDESPAAHGQAPWDEKTSTLDDATRPGSESYDIRQLLALADEARYSGGEPARLDFARWTRIVREELTREERMPEKPMQDNPMQDKPMRGQVS